MLAQAARVAAKPQAHAATLFRPPSAFPAVRSWRTYSREARPSTVQGQQGQSRKGTGAPATGPARQTSPGTSIPKDQTWKPKDAIKFGTPAASSAASNQAESSRKTAEFNRGADPNANTAPKSQPGPGQPRSDPVHRTPSRETDAESANEELRGPQSPEANTEPSGQGGPGPLPDLRQGIPSTFAKEFGFDKQAQKGEADSVKYDLPASGGGEPSAGGRRRRGEEDGDEEFSQSAYETSSDRAWARTRRYMYGSFLLFVLTGGAYFGRPFRGDEEAPTGLSSSELTSWSPSAIWKRLNARMSGSVEYYTEPTSRKLLPDMPEAQRFPYTLVLSLEDLLIHSEWSREHGWRTAKRPGVDYFLRYLSQYYELVVFTSVPSAMGDPVIRKLDPFRIIMWPLYREATKYENGKYIKDLTYLNRPLEKTLIIDTSQDHVSNQPDNAIVLPKWTGDAKGGDAKDLVALIPFLEYIATVNVADVRKVIQSFKGTHIPTEFARREAIARKEFAAQQAQSKPTRPSLGGLLTSALGVKAPPPPGSIVIADGTSTADGSSGSPQQQQQQQEQPQTLGEGLARGKTLADQIRERGQREYMRMEEEIRKNGDKWLKQMEEEEKKAMESSVKDMKRGWFGGLLGGGGGGGAGGGGGGAAAGEAAGKEAGK